MFGRTVFDPAARRRFLPFVVFVLLLALRGLLDGAAPEGLDLRWLYALQVGVPALLMAIWWRDYVELSSLPRWRDALLAVAEARLPKEPWELTAMEPVKRESMLSGIRVIDLVVDRIEGQSKLNQHKSDEDHVAVAKQLARADETASRRLAAKMRGLRPGLKYEGQGE